MHVVVSARVGGQHTRVRQQTDRPSHARNTHRWTAPPETRVQCRGGPTQPSGSLPSVWNALPGNALLRVAGWLTLPCLSLCALARPTANLTRDGLVVSVKHEKTVAVERVVRGAEPRIQVRSQLLHCRLGALVLGHIEQSLDDAPADRVAHVPRTVGGRDSCARGRQTHSRGGSRGDGVGRLQICRTNTRKCRPSRDWAYTQQQPHPSPISHAQHPPLDCPPRDSSVSRSRCGSHATSSSKP
jgi:hypothetical protein